MNMRCCLNPKFLIAAGLIAGATWFVAPNAALPVAVVLVALSCPISMFLSLRRPQNGGSCSIPGAGKSLARSRRLPRRDEEIRSLRAEIEELRKQEKP
jgi:hypothetical protein